MHRPPLTAFAFVVLVVASGCVSSSSTPETTVLPEASYPEPPPNLTADTVERVVLDYEAARLQNHLRDEYPITSFDFGYQRPPNATVVNRTGDGLYVKVDATYSYRYDNEASDFNPVCSLYFVSRTSIDYVAESTCDEEPSLNGVD